MFCSIPLLAGKAFADKASVTLEIPPDAAVGQEIKIKVNVTHDGNNFMHHVDWVVLKANGKEIKKWEFGGFSLPESGKFSKELVYKIEGPTEFWAEADCNLHGSAGPATAKIEPK
jgi:desulfoferrodoxin (superoxide reductase-like protein)